MTARIPNCMARATVALTIVAVLFEPTTVWGEPDAGPLRVDRVVTASRDVRDLLLRPDGLWLATSGGLVRWHQGEGQTLTAADGLPGSRVRALSPGPEVESFWVATVDGVALVRWTARGLRVTRQFDVRRVQRVRHYAGATWFASYGHGLFRLPEGHGGPPERVRIGRHATTNQQTDLLVVDNELWVATAGAGIFRLDRQGERIGRLRSHHGLADEVVWSLQGDAERLLAATAAGLSVIRRGRVLLQARESRAVAALAVRDVRRVARREGTLWLGTFGGGLYRLPPGRGEPQPVSAPAGSNPLHIQALAVGSDRLWVGHRQGLHQLTSARPLERVGLSGLPSLDITSLVRAFGVLWLGTYNHGLARWEEGNLTEVTTERWNMDRRINDLAVTGGGTDRERLWVATDRGLYWHDGRRFVRVVDNQGPGRQHTTSLFVDTDGETLWVTSSRQVCRHHRGRWQAWGGDQSLPLVNLHSVTRSGAGHLWLGSLHGLYRFDPEGGEFTRHSVATGALPVDWVTALLPWGRGLVAGTYHGGLSWFDGQRFTLEREGPGGPMPSGWVNPHSLRWHNDWLWVGTLDRGLVVGRAGQWYHLRRTDGLPSDDVTAILPDGPDGAWVSTRGGLARVSWATTTQHHGRHTEAGRQSLDRP